MTDPRELTWRSSNGLNLFARDYGAGESGRLPVLCVPGLTRNSRDFEEVAPWIAAMGRRVIAVDLRGRGRSDRDPNPANYAPPTYAADIVALMDQQGLPRALFVGTSLGGIVTMTLASKHLDRIGGAVLNDVGPVVAKAGLARIAGYAGKTPPVKSWADAIAYARQTGGVAFPRWTDADWGVFVRRIFRDGPDSVPVLECDPKVFRPVNPILVWLMTPLVWSLFRKLANGRPTLLVRGAISDVLDTPTASRMRKEAPAMAFLEVDDVGHAPTLSEPQAKDALARFFSEAP
ncbi:MAG: alpha/beta hydrolase [Vicinamibacteria bacterium]|nr:alpha/beta hydrolase [Vicinamibacteria bacterium]